MVQLSAKAASVKALVGAEGAAPKSRLLVGDLVSQQGNLGPL